MDTRLRRIVASFLAGALLVCAGACSDGTATEIAEPPPPRSFWKPPAPVNVVFLVIDTLRADAVLDPAGRYDTPNLDRLGSEGVVFPRAFSAAPMTLPSHMSLFSSRPPLETKVLNNGQRVPADLPLLADWLAQNGYHTRAVLSLATLNPLDRSASPSRGFASYDVDYWDIAMAEDTTRRIAASLAKRDAAKPLFLFAHFADPHEPYDAHGSEVRSVQVLKDGKPFEQILVSDTNQCSRQIELGSGRTAFEFQAVDTPPERFRVRRFECREDGKPVPITWEIGKQMERVSKARIVVDRGDRPKARCELRFWVNDVPESDDTVRQRYALEVAYVDRQIGELLAELERQGLYRDSLIVFTSDHGEAMGEKKMFGHVERLTDEQIHVPLIVKLPSVDPREPELEHAARKLVTHLDVVPTLLELIGIPALPGPRGTSLLDPHETVHIAETHRPEARRTQVALRDERFKMVYFPADPEVDPPQPERFELYDLVADPGELKNVFAKRNGERSAWPDQLRLLHEESKGSFQAGGGTESDEERRAREEMLRALGYAGGDREAEQ